MKKIGIKIVVLVLGFLWLNTLIANAQYYSNGAIAASENFYTIDQDATTVITPEYFEAKGRSVGYYMGQMRESVGFGLTTPRPVSVIINGRTLLSNGMAMWTPFRVEMAGAPAIESYSTPWLKQLSVHEYRHIAQYTRLDNHAAGFIGNLLGEQGSLLMTGLLPFWFLEGDATDAETQASLFGRGLQPSFSMHYRAIGSQILEGKNPDRWFSGSYADYIPNHYELGYRLVTHANQREGRYVWGDIIDYSARRPYLIASHQKGMKKVLGIKTVDLFRETFLSNNELWAQAPHIPAATAWEEGVSTIAATPKKGWQSYSHPMWLDSERIVALHSTLDQTDRFVIIDTSTGAIESSVATGTISTRPVMADGVVWWSEYRPSTFFNTKVGSVVRSYDFDSKRLTTHRLAENALYPTPLPEGGLAWVEYNPEGTYTLHTPSGEKLFTDHSLHGLAWDEKTELYYLLAQGDNGMSIISFDPADSAINTIRKPAFVTLSDLRAESGKLYFGSVASGIDNAHSIDLSSLQEERLSEALFGAFDPAPSPDGERVAMTLYSAHGYSVVTAENEGVESVEWSQLPASTINTPNIDWGIPKIDTIDFTESDLTESMSKSPARHYSRIGHLFRFHSYAPLMFDPEEIMEGAINELGLGVTLLSQNITGDMIARVGYGYTAQKGQNASLSLKYLGFAPKLEFTAKWQQDHPTPGNMVRGLIGIEGDTLAYVQRFNNGNLHFDKANPQHQFAGDRNYITLSGRVYLPIFLGGGSSTNYLTPSLEVTHTNGYYWNPTSDSYSQGRTMVYGSVQYSNQTRLAHRDFLPRWGAMVRATYGTGLSGRETSVLSLFSRAYTPGIGPNHAITLRAAYQDILGEGYYTHFISDLQPRGLRSPILPVGYYAFSADYEAPLFYPDRGLRGVLLVKRIRAAIGYDFATYTSYYTKAGAVKSDGLPIIYPRRSATTSFGGSVVFDVVPVRMPEQAEFSVRLSLFVPSDTGKPYFGASVEMPL